jgi:hypothetical protein
MFIYPIEVITDNKEMYQQKNQEPKTISEMIEEIIPLGDKMYLFVFEQFENDGLTTKAAKHIELMGFKIDSINKLNNTIRAILE